MALDFYQNYLDNIARTPNQNYLDDAQAFNNSIWDNSTQTSFQIMEQEGIGSNQWFEQAISVDMAIDLSTGMKKSDDWKIFSYRDLTFDTLIGLMYKYANNYWLTINTDELGGATKSVEVRRCNNFLKWVDSENGYLHNIPCIVDYSIQSPQPLKDKEIITANGHIVVWCQGNGETLKLVKNQRFLFNKQPYKLVSYNNMLQNDIVTEDTTILYFDMYLDMLQADDDTFNNIANATKYVYTLNSTTNVTEQIQGFQGQAYANTMLNNEPIDRLIVWSANEYATVDTNGNYTLTGNVGDIAIITANISGNSDLTSSVSIEIVDTITDYYDLIIEPLYDEVRLKQPISFSVDLYKNGVLQSDEVDYSISGLDNSYYALNRNGNTFTLTALKYSQTPLSLTFSTPNISKTIDVMLRSLF